MAEDLMKKDKNLINKDFAVFIFFLFLSFIFWYLNSLGKEAESEIRLPVKYINLPKERLISEVSPVKLNMYLKGPGYSIMKLKLSGNQKPVMIDISKVNYKRVPGSISLDYYIITSGLTKSLSVQLRYGCEITSIKPDTLFFTFDKTVTKSIQVQSDTKVFSNNN